MRPRLRSTSLLALLLLVTSSVVPLAAQGVSTGPSPLTENSVASQFMRGALGAVDARPVQLRVLGARRTQAGVTFEVLLLDERGNALPAGIDNGTWTIRSGCRGDAIVEMYEPLISGRTWQSVTPPASMQVMIDHSLTSDNIAADVLRGLRDVLPGFIGMDTIGVTVFDHETTQLAPMGAPYQTAALLKPEQLSASDGLPGLYMAMLQGLRVLEDRDDEMKALLVVTGSNDLASLGVTTDDLVRKAQAAGVSIFVVKVGPTVRGFVHRYLTASTGGRLYSLDRDSAEHVVEIVREVMYGAKHHIELFVPTQFDSLTCEDVLFSVGWTDTERDTLLADTLMVPIKERSYGTKRGVLAVFRDTTQVGLKDYYSVLTLLAEDLLADSSKVVQLVGHVSPDIKSDHDARALERVEYVAAFLRATGVPDRQIRVRSDGSRHPLYYLQLDGMQRLMNNRVEAYYLYSADLPYTVIVGQYATEEQAIEWVSTWKQRGFKAYFEPIVVGRSPAYQVKLWGYGSRNEAEADAHKAKHTFKAPVAIVE